MRTLSRDRRAANAERWGFTLVELLVAITIIAILLALLIPAISAARATARVAQVQAEISRLNSACADFKAKFGMNPPSSITLFEAGDANLSDGAGWDSDPRSMGLIRQVFGQQFDFSQNHDLNGDGAIGAGSVIISKGECLVFFLGGIAASEDKDGDLVLDAGEDLNGNSAIDPVPGVLGFSLNPANPFARGGSNRVGPFFEFDVSRFSDVDGNGFFEYRDTLPDQASPYIYFSAYDGQGYLASETPPQLTTGVYLQSAATAWNPQSFQIISPGDDGLYGEGGVFNADTAGIDLAGTREAERDNITSFHNGKLAPN